MATKRMSKTQIRLAVIDAMHYCGKFVPANYGKEYRDEMEEQAWKLVDEQAARWEYMSDGTLMFIPE